jgi:mono/diheme cytochrome c family protein
MVVALPLSLIWYLSAVLKAGIPAGRIMGAGSDTLGAILGTLLSGGTGSGYPFARYGALIALAASGLVALLTLFILLVRKKSYGLALTIPLMILGQLAFAGGEWMREDLRKPYVIGRYMFVNGVRLPIPWQATDRYNVTALNETGVLAASLWVGEPAGFDSRSGPDPALAREEQADIMAQAGGRLFRVLCFSCHTETGYLALEPLVRGKSAGAMESVLDGLARPVDAQGDPTGWSDPDLRLETRLDRRMPPFVGTGMEKKALAVWLARLGGDATAGSESKDAGVTGSTLFEEQCAFCHASDADWPMSERTQGRTPEEFYELLGKLPDLSEYMEPFEGSREERRALAEHLAGMEE